MSQPVSTMAEEPVGAAPHRRPLFAATIFASAFLLFQVQPLIAKLILPWFGGSAAVWATCMLFFQVALLGGYLYAHWTTRHLTPQRQAYLHAALLALSLVVLPIAPNSAWQPVGADNPSLRILGLLAASVGLPYFLLSTTGPLVQAWYARVFRGAVPYRLFALSNFASLAALLTYPVAVEPFLRARHQSLIWSAGYVVFAVLAVWTALRSRHARPLERQVAVEEEGGSPPSWADYALWIALPGCASVLLLAVTNFLTQDVASIPFLWILPLTLYLLSFVLCFDAQGWYRRLPFLGVLALSLAGMTYRLWSDEKIESMPAIIALYCTGFFVCCMVCHGELASMKPHPRYLTAFYLMMSVGGAAGGLFVGLVAPNVFNGNHEFPIGIAACLVLVLIVLYRHPASPLRGGRNILAWCFVAAYAAGLCGFLTNVVRQWGQGSRVVARNFYGGLRVSDEGDLEDLTATRKLRHGSINHGEQFLHPSRRLEPSTYYCPESGVGMAIGAVQSRPSVRVGVIGLGAGSLAAYGRRGDYYKFYEINPLVLQIASSEFTYTRDSPAKVDFALGDARLTMEREAPQNYDVLAVDAFSGDSIPVHLLTREAIELYFRHLRTDGLLAVHISNRHLDLRPVLKQAVRALGKTAREFDTDDNDENGCFGCTWVLLANQDSAFANLALQTAPTLDSAKTIAMWTDDYSNLLRILK